MAQSGLLGGQLPAKALDEEFPQLLLGVAHAPPQEAHDPHARGQVDVLGAVALRRFGARVVFSSVGRVVGRRLFADCGSGDS